jgi:hypothetical protein
MRQGTKTNNYMNPNLDQKSGLVKISKNRRKISQRVQNIVKQSANSLIDNIDIQEILNLSKEVPNFSRIYLLRHLPIKNNEIKKEYEKLKSRVKE